MQKVIIPKGVIDPQEMTIIEIPQQLQGKPTVIAKPKTIQTENVLKTMPSTINEEDENLQTVENAVIEKNDKVGSDNNFTIHYDASCAEYYDDCRGGKTKVLFKKDGNYLDVGESKKNY